MNNTSLILLRRKNLVLLKKGSNKQCLSNSYIASILKNIESLGYTLSKDVINALRTVTVSTMIDFYKTIIHDLRELLGASVNYEPMYPNFPQQVMDASDAELYLNAILHYLTNGHFVPKYEKQVRMPLFENTNLIVIGLGSTEDIFNIARNLLSSKTPLSEVDKADLNEIVKHYGIANVLPEQIPLRENMALSAKYIINDAFADNKLLVRYIKTATDVLRLAAALSDGDISLAEPTHFRKFNRPERKLILNLLENSTNLEEDMLRYKNEWLRIGEIIHPREYRKDFPRTAKAFNKLRNNIKIFTFNSNVQSALDNERYYDAARLLKTRPGEFARKLDLLLRKTKNPFPILKIFEEIASSVSVPVLLELRTHFAVRNAEIPERVIFPKGNVSKAMVIENKLPAIDRDVCQYVIHICETALRNNFAKRPYLGKVYIAESLKKITVPFSQRSASKSLKSLSRGSRFPIPECKVIRPFIYWKENTELDEYESRIDIDLSALFLADDWQYMGHISFTNLKNIQLNCCHSGDFVNARNGASEFVDLDIKKLRDSGIRYVMISVFAYTNTLFKDIPECFMGWMSRKEPESGEIYEPSTVQEKIDLTGNTKIELPIILDLKENEIVWLDIALKSSGLFNCVENNGKNISIIGKALTSMAKPNLYDLFALHALARGQIVDNKEDANTVFDFDGTVTPYDTDVIISKYL